LYAAEEENVTFHVYDLFKQSKFPAVEARAMLALARMKVAGDLKKSVGLCESAIETFVMLKEEDYENEEVWMRGSMSKGVFGKY
jgi:hypothetical protein